MNRLGFFCLCYSIFICFACTSRGAQGTQDAQYVADLAWRYLELEVDAEGSRLINEEINRLNAEQIRIFVSQLQLLGNADPRQVAIGNQLAELAITRGQGLLKLDDEALKGVLSEFESNRNSDPGSPNLLCSLWMPVPAVSLYGFNSIDPGTTASWSDRASTSFSELLGCDHRFYFIGTKTLIDGKTAAYDDWISRYPSILGQHTGAGTYALMGNGKALLAHIYSVDYTQLKTY